MSFDWIASLDYHWASTMWGVYIFSGAAGAGMALIILVVVGLKNAGYLWAVNEEHYHIMGKLLLTFSIFWGYIGFSQYMLIWYGNIPEETQWFLRRNVESWNVLSTFMVVGRFFIPFLYLLFQFTKRNPKFLSFICFWVLAMHVLILTSRSSRSSTQPASRSTSSICFAFSRSGARWRFSSCAPSATCRCSLRATRGCWSR
jgi:hypothetical protein